MSSASSGSFGFTRLINLSPSMVSFLARCSLLERLFFSVMRWDGMFIDEILNLFMNLESNDLEYDKLEKGKVRAVTRMLLLPTNSEARLLRRRFATGPEEAPFEPLVVSHQERLISNIRLLRSSYAFIPRARAPLINAYCPDRNFVYQAVEELHHPWAKRLFVGFARTSEFNGPRRPINTHHLIEEIDTKEFSFKPVLELSHRIFGSSPPMQSFDPAKMLTIKDRQKKKRGNKGIRVDANGLVSLEELENGELRRTEDEPAEKQSGKPSNKKRKSGSDKQNSARPSNPQESSTLADSPMEADEASPMVLEEKPSRPKRIKKSVNRNLEPSPSSATGSVTMNSAEHFPPSMFEHTRGIDGAIAQEVMGLQYGNTIEQY